MKQDILKSIDSYTTTNKETNMDCDSVWDLLSVYADGEASPEEAALVEQHVELCADCARDLEFMQSTSAVIQEMPEVAPPAYLREAILAATVNHQTLAQRFAASVRAAFAPVPARYGALATAGAAVALALAVLHGNSIDLAPRSINNARANNSIARVGETPAIEKSITAPAANHIAVNPILPVATIRNPRSTFSVANASMLEPARSNRVNLINKYKPHASDAVTDGVMPDADVKNAAVSSPANTGTGTGTDTAVKPTNPVATASANTDSEAPRPTRIELVASAPMNPASLSALKDRPRASNTDWRIRETDLNNNDHSIRVGVIKSSF